MFPLLRDWLASEPEDLYDERTLDVGTKLYRADPTGPVEALQARGDAPMWFFEDANPSLRGYAHRYGTGTYNEYVVRRPLRLLVMSDPATANMITKRLGNPDFAYAFEAKENFVYRRSDKDLDMELAKALCKLGYDGYIAEATIIPKGWWGRATEGYFHPELMLCTPADDVLPFATHDVKV